MGLFSPDVKFVKLVAAIDERYKLYETLADGDPEKVPKGLKTLLQEFRNLKIRAWDIEKGDKVARLIKDFKKEELEKKIEEEGDLP